MSEESLFAAALEKPPAERARFLEEACGADAALLQRLRELLAAHEKSAGILERPGATGAYESQTPPADLAVGTVVSGRFKLLECLGEGGMGTVYVAEQSAPIRRKVALKLIKLGMDSKSVLARFEAERQALALMDHPNIAKVIDGGLTEQNRPYFVMEYIKGVPLTEYCDAAKLTICERLDLFTAVCQAVQHAHQKGIIHRDLKPSNILVALYDGKPVPKVIDFGLAKAIHQPLTERSLYTGHQMVLGTPLYMSPEQSELNNLDVDTRTDIYSLGVILYELLTGTTPLDRERFQQAAWDEMLRLIREEEPSKPSTKLSGSAQLPNVAANRHTEPLKLAKLLRGDLDWIAMKALEKERSRRYETANGLARDLQRYLADEPVEACPPSAGYRLRKLARKHRRLLATAAAFVLLLATAAAVSAGLAVWALRSERAAVAARDDEAKQRTEAERQRDEANEQRRRTRQALDDMLNDESLAYLTTQKELLPQQKAFLERALKYYQEFAAQAPMDPEGLALVPKAQLRVGHIYRAMGKRKDAEAPFRSALELRMKLATEHPGVSNYLQDVATCHYYLGELFDDLGQPTKSEAAYRAALTLDEKLAADFPTVPVYRYDLATTHRNLGRLLRNTGNRNEAELEFQAALVLFEKLPGDEPKYLRDLALCHNSLGILLESTGRWTQAKAEYEAALVVHEKLAPEQSALPVCRRDLAAIHNNHAIVLKFLGKLSESVAAHRRALLIREKLAAEYPAVPEYRKYLADSYTGLGGLLRDLGRMADAETEYRAAVAERARLAADFPDIAEFRRDLGSSHDNLSRLFQELGRRAEAEMELRSALAIREKLAAEHPELPESRQDLADSQMTLGLLLNSLGKRSEAEASIRKTVAVYEKLTSDFPDFVEYRYKAADSHEKLGKVLKDEGSFPEAVAEYQSALATQEKLVAEFPAVPAYTVHLCAIYGNFGNLVRDQEEPARALDWYAKAIATLEPVFKTNPRLITAQQCLRITYTSRAQVLITLDRPAEALADWERALTLDDGRSRVALRLGRIGALVRIGETPKAMAEADELSAIPDLRFPQLYDLACNYALTAARVPPPDAERTAARAVSVLRRAVAKGYRDFAHMLKDDDLVAIRGRDDFAALLWDFADLPVSGRPGS